MHWPRIIRQHNATKFEQHTKLSQRCFASEVQRSCIAASHLRTPESGFDLPRNPSVRRSAKNKPTATCPSLDFHRCRNETLNRPALRWPVLRARIESKESLSRIVPQIKSKRDRFHLFRSNMQIGCNWSAACTERRREVEILVNLVSARRVLRVACCLFPVVNQAIDFSGGTFAHFNMLFAGSNKLINKPISPWTRVSNPFRNSRQPNFQSRAWWVGKDQCCIEFLLAQATGNGPSAIPRRKCHDPIEARMTLPQVPKLFVGQQRDVRFRQCLAQPLQRWSRHNRVAEPIHASNQNAKRSGRHASDVVDH